MDEEELLYREMNEEDPFYMDEEDPFYMGNSSLGQHHNTHTRLKSYRKNTPYKHTNNTHVNNNNGCLTNFIGFIVVCLIVLILILIFC